MTTGRINQVAISKSFANMQAAAALHALGVSPSTETVKDGESSDP